MLISIQRLKELCPCPKGILQLGAYDGEEKKYWDEWGCTNVIYVEPNPTLYQRLVKNVGIQNALNIAIFDKDNIDLEFTLCYSKDRTNLGASSLLKPKNILVEHPALEIIRTISVKTSTIDKILENRLEIDFLAMDIQGSELLALAGAIKSLYRFKCILTEFSIKSLYENDCSLDELDNFLTKFGFKRIITEFATDIWGDAFYIK